MYFTHPSVAQYEKLVNEGHVKAVFNPPLVLFNYTDKCTYDRNWNELTKQARGLIYHMETGEVVARPFPKFFNLGENEESNITNLTGFYTVHEKMDGSLGIIYYYSGRWNVATRGSFSSDQAIRASEILKKYDLSELSTDITLLTEIIYPENKIIVNYGENECLVILGAFWTKSGIEVDSKLLELISWETGIELAPVHNYTIEQMIEMQKTMPKDQEGFVVRFESGKRVKVKGHEYLKMAKIMSQMTPLAFWEVMEMGKIPDSYLSQIPEELRPEWEPIVHVLESSYLAIYTAAHNDFSELFAGGHTARDIGILLKDNPEITKYPRLMFPILNNKRDQVNKIIHKMIRPTNNIIGDE